MPDAAVRGTCGRVKWFDDASGYGFITPEGRGRELFVRQMIVVGAGATLSAGELVEYRSREGGMGLEAIDVLRAAQKAPVPSASPPLFLASARWRRLLDRLRRPFGSRKGGLVLGAIHLGGGTR